MKKLWWILAVAVIAAGAFFLVRRGDADRGDEGRARAASPAMAESATAQKTLPTVEPEEVAEPETPDDADDVEPPPSAEEIAEAEEEAKVEAFDALTDKWMEPSEKGVTMADVDAFAQMFATVPKDRREECLQRALNLIPDENVLLLAGILMDRSLDRDLTELVFNDILNRDDDVKQPILKEVLKDETHPCRKDAAWILDVPEEEPRE